MDAFEEAEREMMEIEQNLCSAEEVPSVPETYTHMFLVLFYGRNSICSLSLISNNYLFISGESSL